MMEFLGSSQFFEFFFELEYIYIYILESNVKIKILELNYEKSNILVLFFLTICLHILRSVMQVIFIVL